MTAVRGEISISMEGATLLVIQCKMVGAETITHKQQKRTMKDIFMFVHTYENICTNDNFKESVLYKCWGQMAGIGSKARGEKGRKKAIQYFN